MVTTTNNCITDDIIDKTANIKLSGKTNNEGFTSKSLQVKFDELVKKTTLDQAEFFLTSFVFALGENWKEVLKLADVFQTYLDSIGEKEDLDAGQAADFLQKQGRTRTAAERRSELKDIDLDMNDRICFTEYLLLHFKVLILQEYFRRHKTEPTVSLANDGIGLTGVGPYLLEELFTIPNGMSVDLQKTIESFMMQKKKRAETIAKFEAIANLGGVKGLTAKNELAQLSNQDFTEFNRIELTLAAAKRRSSTNGGDNELIRQMAVEKQQEKAKNKASRDKLKNRAAAFER